MPGRIRPGHALQKSPDWRHGRSLSRPGLVHPQRLQPGGGVPDPPRGEHSRVTGPRGEGTHQRRVAYDAGQPTRTRRAPLPVSARGHGQWVRNLRAAGTGELRVGKRTEAFRGRELTDDEKVPILRAYLKRWKAEVGVFFGGVGPDSSDEQLRAIAPDHPAFEVLAVA